VKVFIFDAEKCNGCYNCQIACKDEHCGNDWFPYAKPQPDTGHFWLKLNEREHGSIPKVKVEYYPTLCMHCDNPPCITESGGSESPIYKREDGLVVIDPEKSAGRSDLADLCPYGAIYWNYELNIPQKCTGCAHLVDEGKLPHCVDLCATGAWRFGDESDFAEEIRRAKTLLPELNEKPRVYYINMPKLFIGGEVWNPADDEVIKNADITLINVETGAEHNTKSDHFGDFWFRRLDIGSYSLIIEADGFESVSVDNIELDKSLNLGDFPLRRAT